MLPCTAKSVHAWLSPLAGVNAFTAETVVEAWLIKPPCITVTISSIVSASFTKV